jgi:hypothetical protein
MSCEPKDGNTVKDKTLKGLGNAKTLRDANKLANNAVTHMKTTYQAAANTIAEVVPYIEAAYEVYNLAADPAKIVTFLVGMVAIQVKPYVETYIKNSETIARIASEMAEINEAYECCMQNVNEALTLTSTPEIPITANTMFANSTIPYYASNTTLFYTPPDFTLPTLDLPDLPQIP